MVNRAKIWSFRMHNIPLIDRPRYRLLISRLHSTGERSLGEFVARLQRLCPDLPVMAELEKFATIDVDVIKQTGADKWPVRLHAVPQSVMRHSISSGTADRATILARSLVPGRSPDGAA
jgi:hypothetical protein